MTAAITKSNVSTNSAAGEPPLRSEDIVHHTKDMDGKNDDDADEENPGRNDSDLNDPDSDDPDDADGLDGPDPNPESFFQQYKWQWLICIVVLLVAVVFGLGLHYAQMRAKAKEETYEDRLQYVLFSKNTMGSSDDYKDDLKQQLALLEQAVVAERAGDIVINLADNSCDVKRGVHHKDAEKVVKAIQKGLNLTDDIADGMVIAFDFEDGEAREVNKITADNRFIYGRYMIQTGRQNCWWSWCSNSPADFTYAFTVWEFSTTLNIIDDAAKIKDHSGDGESKTGSSTDGKSAADDGSKVGLGKPISKLAIKALFQKHGIDKLRKSCKELSDAVLRKDRN